MTKISLNTVYLLAEMGDERARYLIRHGASYVCRGWSDLAYLYSCDLL